MSKSNLFIKELDNRESERDAQIESRLTALETSIPNIHEDIRDMKRSIEQQTARIETMASAIQQATIATLQDRNKTQQHWSLGAITALVSILSIAIGVAVSFIIAFVNHR